MVKIRGLNNSVTLNPYGQCPESNFTYPEYLKYSNLNSLSLKAISNQQTHESWMLIEDPPEGDWKSQEFMKTNFFYFNEWDSIQEAIVPNPAHSNVKAALVRFTNPEL